MLAKQPNKLALVATGSFPVVAADTHTITIKRPDSSVENISCNRVVKTATPRSDWASKPSCPIDDLSRILDLLACPLSLTLALNGFTLKKGVQAAHLSILVLTTRPRRYMV